jgi:hypothetical protein
VIDVDCTRQHAASALLALGSASTADQLAHPRSSVRTGRYGLTTTPTGPDSRTALVGRVARLAAPAMRRHRRAVETGTASH